MTNTLMYMQVTNNLGYLINHVAFVMGRQSDIVLQDKLGIGFSQFKIMMVLMNNPHVQQKEIAERLGQTEASISRQIKLLINKGLLQSLKRPENKREHITTLTFSGESMTEEALTILNNYHAPVFEHLTDQQKQILMSGVSSMHDIVCSSSRPGSCQHLISI